MSAQLIRMLVVVFMLGLSIKLKDPPLFLGAIAFALVFAAGDS